MGILNDVIMGKRDFVNADVENLSDPRNWPYPKRVDARSKPTKEDKETTEQSEEVEFESSKDGI